MCIIFAIHIYALYFPFIYVHNIFHSYMCIIFSIHMFALYILFPSNIWPTLQSSPPLDIPETLHVSFNSNLLAPREC